MDFVQIGYKNTDDGNTERQFFSEAKNGSQTSDTGESIIKRFRNGWKVLCREEDIIKSKSKQLHKWSFNCMAGRIPIYLRIKFSYITGK